jgi:hypothetical protein
MSKGAGHHAGAATLAFFQIDEEKPLGVWYGQHVARKQPLYAHRRSKSGDTGLDQELPSCHFLG